MTERTTRAIGDAPVVESSPELPALDVAVAVMTAADREDVAAFLRGVPRGEYLFMKENLDDIGQSETWARHENGDFLVGRVGDEVVAVVGVVPGVGWSRHVGQMRLVVAPRWRGRGVGALLARNAMRLAVEQELSKVTVEILADQPGVLDLFRGLDFVAEALLEDQVRDDDGEFHDLLVLAHPVLETWSLIETIGVGEPGSTEVGPDVIAPGALQ